jgi:predicted polyphosphate/ATP-dependent NAD kinase
MFKLGLIVNPLAGIGGPLALKGSDGQAIVQQAEARGARHSAVDRATQALQVLRSQFEQCQVWCFGAEMGARSAEAAGIQPHIIGHSESECSTAFDTIHAARQLKSCGVDLLMFAGGDGTARDIYQAVGESFPVLGIPAGVKMHSGVYAISPSAAGEIVLRLMTGKLVDVGPAEVRDIDENAFREGRVKTRFYGELLVPKEGQFLQHVKSSGREVEELVLQDIAADIVESMIDDSLYLIGPGTTPAAIMQELGLHNTLLGVDAIAAGALVGTDLDESAIVELIDRYKGNVKIVITAIGGQGHIIGRGNQQISANVIRAVGIDSITVVATKTKITELHGRPLLVDSGDPELDQAFRGLREVVTGYHDAIIYPVGLDRSAQ